MEFSLFLKRNKLHLKILGLSDSKFVDLPVSLLDTLCTCSA